MIPTSESTSSLAAADFDLDGKLDIYVCCYAPNKASDPEESLVMGGASRRFIYHDDNNGPKNYMLKNMTRSDGKISFKDFPSFTDRFRFSVFSLISPSDKDLIEVSCLFIAEIKFFVLSNSC